MNRKIINVTLSFLLPILTFYFFELFFKGFIVSRFYNVIENLLFASVLIIVSLIVNNTKFRKVFLKLAFVVFCVCLFFETFYYYHFESIFSDSALFVILETNTSEASDFLMSYFNTAILFLFLLLLAHIVFGIKVINKNDVQADFKKTEKIKFWILILLVLVFLKITKIIVYNVPYLIIRIPISYYHEMQKLGVYGKQNPLGKFTNVEHKTIENKKELYVIVVGESTSRLHFKLNGNYYRETTPLLSGIKDELIILNNVISPHAYTIGSLTKGLTLGNLEYPEGQYEGSVIQLLNQANFKTYWISNQRPVGISDTHVTKIARGANTSIFLNLKHTSEKTPYDENLIAELDKIVMEKGDKKVVFLHMIGAHFYYENRYPQKFDYFKDVPKTKFKREEVYNTINAYDNVMRYTDSILYEIIKTTKKQNANSFVLYFSDHGQEVYGEIDFFGQTIDQMVTKNMYKIPMFLWVSDHYKSNKPLALNEDKKYMTDDLIHTIADLCNVSSTEIDSTRSIFNDSFKERKRIIKQSIDFDVLFKDSIN